MTLSSIKSHTWQANARVCLRAKSHLWLLCGKSTFRHQICASLMKGCPESILML